MSRQDKGGAGMILNRGPPSGFETSNKISNSGGTDKDASKAVCLYCHRKTLPEDLEFVVRELVINKVKADNDGNIQSIKRGDTQINYATETDIIKAIWTCMGYG